MIELAGEEVIKASAQLADADLLSRCLVGHFSSKGDAPTRSDVRRWAMGAPNLERSSGSSNL